MAVAILDQLLHLFVHHSDTIAGFFSRPVKGMARSMSRVQLVPKRWSSAISSSSGSSGGGGARRSRSGSGSDKTAAAAAAGSAAGQQQQLPERPGAESAEAAAQLDAGSEAGSGSSDRTDLEAGCCDESSCCDCPLVRQGPGGAGRGGAERGGAGRVLVLWPSHGLRCCGTPKDLCCPHGCAGRLAATGREAARGAGLLWR